MLIFWHQQLKNNARLRNDKCANKNKVPSYEQVSWQLFFLLLICTVCPGSSDPPEKILNIFASENEVYTIF